MENSMSAEYKYPSDYSDDSDSDADVTWSPGDGVCPSKAQFNDCFQSKFDDWKCASSAHMEGSNTFPFYMNAFLNLLKNVPPFFQCPPENVHITGRPKSFLIMRSSLHIKTTEDPDCSDTQKSIDYMQCLGCPAPAVYKPKAEAQLQAVLPLDTKPFRSGYFTNIVLAWSYIISCRWVEIFHQAGEKSELLHKSDMQIEDSFWHIVTKSCWVALVKRRNGYFYSPWMLTSEGTTKNRYVYHANHHCSCWLITHRDEWKPVTTNSYLAFSILLEFCISQRLEGEFLTGLVSVLLLTSRNAPTPKFAPPIKVLTAPVASPLRQNDQGFHELFESIDKCIFLSSTQDALDSLACSAFFDPSVPCNLIGAASLGIRKALSSENEIDNRQFLKAIAYMKPHLSLFWAAIMRNDQVTSYLNLALNSLPPICLVAGLLTETTQSFLQIAYQPSGEQKGVISRGNEFQTSYYCHPDISVPWSPAPPFGRTPIENVSLEIRTHLGHMHRPISWMINWTLDSGERLPASDQHQVPCFRDHTILRPCSIEPSNE